MTTITMPAPRPPRIRPGAEPTNLWGQIGRALRASATRIMGRKVDRTINLATAKGGWQAEAWDLYDLVGEERRPHGRASCRESVCTYCKVAVGAVTVKKTYKNI